MFYAFLVILIVGIFSLSYFVIGQPCSLGFELAIAYIKPKSVSSNDSRKSIIYKAFSSLGAKI